jgi:hypothetical protein
MERTWNCAKCGVEFKTDTFRSVCPQHDKPINPAWARAMILDEQDRVYGVKDE